MKKDQKLLSLTLAALLLITAVGIICAQMNAWNRPEPLMDYAPQEIGIYDTRYDHLGEMDCRGCHGASLADRHHYSETVLIYNQCTPCHEIIPDPPGVVVIRDCTTSGCHSWDDVLVNGWHHNTNLSASENCVACHDRNLVAEITPFTSFVEYEPSVVTPTPFSCENCHWEQPVAAASGPNPSTDPNDAGHPSTYDHYNDWGQPIGYYEYGTAILHNLDTHHMGWKGNVAAQCYKCHSNDPSLPSWDYTDPELIRYCEVCHDVSTLHTIVPHVGTGGTGDPPAVDGWEAVGFNVPGSPGGTPDTYRTFYANEQCFGCHADLVPEYVDANYAAAPVLASIAPTSTCPTQIVELLGSNFGEEWIPGREVQIKEGVDWISVPIYSWTDTRIEIEVPGWTFTAGNHKIRVRCEERPGGKKNSSNSNLTILDCCSPTVITPDSGPCKTVIKLTNPSGAQFGDATDGVDDIGAPGEDGVYHAIVVVASQGAYVSLNVTKYTKTKVKFRFKNFFEDLDGDFIQDTGEPTIPVCEDLNLVTWDIYIKYIFYNDSDSSGGYSEGDTVYGVETSNSIAFELTNEPFITQVNPKSLAKGQRLKIYGSNFGPYQTDGEVRIGKKKHYETDPLNKGKVMSKIKDWSNTRIKVVFQPKNAWVPSRKFVWVVKDGKVSNRMKVNILP